ncbi:MAG TPA: RnfABCDGE type electron transport complex subunit B [Clostridiaceae bacterium]|jgi:electron transport complex protein RnfB|nr:RnfABCDGE type electron transport complex subunit B [Clostridiaceae bacterium]
MLQEILIPVAILGGLGLFFGLCLSYASKKFGVKVDERIGKVRDVLPGANCGACGFTGCDGYAEAVVSGNADINKCTVGGRDVMVSIGEILGKDTSTSSVECKVGRVMCGADNGKTRTKYDYSGIKDCTAATALYGGPTACMYGCIGMGDCAKACPFGAIVVERGVARVLAAKCKGCGKCVEVCPRNIIKIVPKEKQYTVRCNNPQRGNFVMKVCKVGCIGCRKCSKVCEAGAITNDGFVARINPELCTNCGKCMEVCPNHVINKYPVCSDEGPAAVNE